MVDNGHRTDTSADNEHDAKKIETQISGGISNGAPRIITEGVLSKNFDSKTQRRLAQNREAARKSRLRKKAYVQQLENSRIRLNQLEQELQQVRQQGLILGSNISTDQIQPLGGNGITGVMNSGHVAFDMEYSHWLDVHNRLINDLRTAIHGRIGDNELRNLVDAILSHYDEFFHFKSSAAKEDVFHLLSGMWKSPVERFFLWMGGYRPSDVLKILAPQVEPLTEQQLLGICNLQQSSQQAEDALSQGMDNLQQLLAETLFSGSLGAPGPSGNAVSYMGQIAMAMDKLSTFESLVRQADHLRQQTLQQLHRILTTRQSAHALLAISDYFCRLRALSSLWLARPHD
eukprot:c22624_g1_i1 orf=1420-2454(+)